MEYIWEPLIEYLRQEKDRSDLHFRVQNNRVSPYLELQTDSIYEQLDEKKMDLYLDVNPFVRFLELFSFLTSDDYGYNELNQELADVMLQFLADLDIQSGMCKREFYIRFLIQDMENGVFGNDKILEVFCTVEKRMLAEELLTLYETKDYFSSLIGIVKKLFLFCELYIRDKEELVFYMREEENQIQKEKLNIVCELFLPISFPYVIHWSKTYGLIGHGDTMRLEEFIL